MSNRCVFCGEFLNEDGICPNSSQHFKPMCLNCVYCSTSLIDGSVICTNEQNKYDAEQKIKNSCDFGYGYEIVNLELNPLPLKSPTKKCKRYTINKEMLADSYAIFTISSKDDI